MKFVGNLVRFPTCLIQVQWGLNLAIVEANGVYRSAFGTTFMLSCSNKPCPPVNMVIIKWVIWFVTKSMYVTPVKTDFSFTRVPCKPFLFHSLPKLIQPSSQKNWQCDFSNPAI